MKRMVLVGAFLGIGLLAWAGPVRAEKAAGIKTAEQVEAERQKCQTDCGNRFPCSKLRPQQCDQRVSCINICNDLHPKPKAGSGTGAAAQ